MFIGRTGAEAEAPILWPPDVKNWHMEKTLMLGKTDPFIGRWILNHWTIREVSKDSFLIDENWELHRTMNTFFSIQRASFYS